MLKTKVAVALCTFNGSRFLNQQLTSIEKQTRVPDELIVCDDASTDNTVALIEQFRDRVPFPVRIFNHPTNMGTVKNFDRAVRLCSSDFIALCDQDDVWTPERLQVSEEYLQQHPEVGFVFSNGRLIDEEDRVQPKTLWQTFKFDHVLQECIAAHDYSVLLRHRFITGATVMLRSTLLPHLLPLPPSWVHDEWMAAVAPFYSEMGMLPHLLINYRIHGAQQVGASSVRRNSAVLHWSQITRARSQMCELMSHLQDHPPQRNPALLDLYRERADALQRRISLPSGWIHRTAAVARYYSDYTNHAAGLLSAAKDIVLPLPRNISKQPAIN